MSKEQFDRIAITSTDITMTCYREQDNEQTITEMRSSSLKWLKSFDSVMSFMETDDLDVERWKIDDAQFIAEYLLTRRNTCGDIYAVFEAEISPSLIVCGDFELNYNKVFKSVASSNLTLIRKIGE